MNKVVRYTPLAANVTLVAAAAALIFAVCTHISWPESEVIWTITKTCMVLWPFLAAIGWTSIRNRSSLARLAVRLPVRLLACCFLYMALCEAINRFTTLGFGLPDVSYLAFLFVGLSGAVNVAAMFPNTLLLKGEGIKMLGCGSERHAPNTLPSLPPKNEIELRPRLIIAYGLVTSSAALAMTVFVLDIYFYEAREILRMVVYFLFGAWCAMLPEVGEQFVRMKSRVGIASMFLPVVLLGLTFSPASRFVQDHWFAATLFFAWFFLNATLTLGACFRSIERREHAMIGKQSGGIPQKAGISPIDESSQ